MYQYLIWRGLGTMIKVGRGYTDNENTDGKHWIECLHIPTPFCLWTWSWAFPGFEESSKHWDGNRRKRIPQSDADVIYTWCNNCSIQCYDIGLHGRNLTMIWEPWCSDWLLRLNFNLTATSEDILKDYYLCYKNSINANIINDHVFPTPLATAESVYKSATKMLKQCDKYHFVHRNSC